jgi:sortase A
VKGSVVLAVLTVLAVWQLGSGAAVQVKAWLGQALLERAWRQTGATRAQVEPWPGAISYPVARLRVPELGIQQLVLNGADTPVLAWGPGMESGRHGLRLIAGHRDTHFRFLRRLGHGHRLHLDYSDGSIEHWRVVATRIIDARTTRLNLDLALERLYLVTCYPFDALRAGGPWRWVVELERDSRSVVHGPGADADGLPLAPTWPPAAQPIIGPWAKPGVQR